LKILALNPSSFVGVHLLDGLMNVHVKEQRTRRCGGGGDQNKRLPRYIVEGGHMGEHGVGVKIGGENGVAGKDGAPKGLGKQQMVACNSRLL